MDDEAWDVESLGAFNVLPSEVVITIVCQSRLIDVLQLCKVSRNMRAHATHSNSNLKERLLKVSFYYIDTKRPRLAVETLETAVNLFPHSLDLYKELGCSWMDCGKYQKAVRIFRKGVEAAGDNPYGHILRAQVKWALGNTQEAWECANRAVQAAPRDPRAYHFRGFTQSLLAGVDDRTSQLTEVKDYQFILEHLTDYSRTSIIHNNLGYVYYEMREYEKANHHFDMSSKMCPYHIQTYYNKAVCVADQGRHEEAIKLCNKMFEINANHADAYSLRGWIHIGNGDISKSVEMYKLAVANQEQPDSYSMLIYTGGLCVLNRFQEAYEFFESILPQIEAKEERLREKIEAATIREEKRLKVHGGLVRASTEPVCRCKPPGAPETLPSEEDDAHHARVGQDVQNFANLGAPPSTQAPISAATATASSSRNSASSSSNANEGADAGSTLVSSILDTRSCPIDARNHQANNNLVIAEILQSDPDSEIETIKYWKTKLLSCNSVAAAAYRVMGEMDLALGRFDRLHELYGKFLAALVGHCEASQLKLKTPLLRHCVTLDLSQVRQPVINLVLKYHKLRESGDAERSFSALQRYLSTLQDQIKLNLVEQQYLLACVGHFLLALFWEDEQFSTILDQVLDYWKTPDTNFEATAQPAFLIGMLDLVSRLGHGAEVQMLLRAAIAQEGEENGLFLRLLRGLNRRRQERADQRDDDDDEEDEEEEELEEDDEEDEEEDDNVYKFVVERPHSDSDEDHAFIADNP